jgi:hypothetical protein
MPSNSSTFQSVNSPRQHHHSDSVEGSGKIVPSIEIPNLRAHPPSTHTTPHASHAHPLHQNAVLVASSYSIASHSIDSTTTATVASANSPRHVGMHPISVMDSIDMSTSSKSYDHHSTTRPVHIHSSIPTTPSATAPQNTALKSPAHPNPPPATTKATTSPSSPPKPQPPAQPKSTTNSHKPRKSVNNNKSPSRKTSTLSENAAVPTTASIKYSNMKSMHGEKPGADLTTEETIQIMRDQQKAFLVSTFFISF